MEATTVPPLGAEERAPGVSASENKLRGIAYKGVWP